MVKTLQRLQETNDICNLQVHFKVLLTPSIQLASQPATGQPIIIIWDNELRDLIATLHVLNAKITQNLVCISINANLVDVTGDDICKVSNLFPKYLLSVSKFRGNPLGSVTETGNVWLRNLHHFSPQTRMVANQPCWIPAPKIITLSESKA